MNPKEALEFAEKCGPSDKTRKIACEDSKYAYLYAYCVDKKPLNETRVTENYENYEIPKYPAFT